MYVETEYSIASLTDDGTMDTVLTCQCRLCGKIWQERFMDADRDEMGCVTEAWLHQAVQQAEEDHSAVCPVEV